MKYRLRIYPAAEDDVDNAAPYIAQDNVRAALRFFDAVANSYSRIRENPKRFPRFELDHPKLVELRKCSVTGFANYLIFYLIQSDAVDVIRVLHGARDLAPILFEEISEE